MLWQRNEIWDVWLAGHTAVAARRGNHADDAGVLCFEADSAVQAWQALLQKLPMRARISLQLSSALVTAFQLNGTRKLRERDWQMLAQTRAREIGVSAERLSIALDRHWQGGPRFAAAADSAVLEALQSVLAKTLRREAQTGQAAREKVNRVNQADQRAGLLTQVRCFALEEVGRHLLDGADPTGDALIAVRDPDGWTLAGVAQGECRFILGYPAAVSEEALAAEAARAALAHGLQTGSMQVRKHAWPLPAKAAGTLPVEVLATRHSPRSVALDLLPVSTVAAKSALLVAVVVVCVCVGFLMQARQQLQLTQAQIKHQQVLLQQQADEAASSLPDSRERAARIDLQALTTHWPAIFAQFEAITKTPDVQANSFAADARQRSVTVQLVGKSDEHLETFIEDASRLGWDVASIRPKHARQAGADEVTEVLLRAESAQPEELEANQENEQQTGQTLH